MEYCKKQIKSDCEEILGRFRKTDSVRFEVFSNIWREMKFSHIFYGTLSRETREFSRQLLDAACSFFLPPFNFQIRVGGLYLLYSLYHSQITTPKEKIRLALKHWEDVKKFERDAVDAQHIDTVYILRHLLFQKAFHFTAMPKLLKYRQKRTHESTMPCEDFIERTSRPQELVSINLLEELSNIHDHYKQLKDSVLPTADPSLSLIHDDLLPQLRHTVVDFHRWQKDKDTSHKDDSSGEGTSAQQECSRRAELLAAIKSKSYGQAVEASKSRRHRQVEIDFTSSESGPAVDEAQLYRRRESLRARTNKNVQLKGAIKKEAEKTTKLWRLAAPDSAPEDIPRVFRKFKW